MNRLVSLLSVVGAAFCVNAEDFVCEWKSDEAPASLLDGKVSIGYDPEGKIISMTASPGAGDRIVFRGDGMAFGAAAITNASAGTVVFENDILADSITVSAPDSPDAELSYVGYANFIGPDPELVFAGQNLEDYRPVAVKMVNDDGNGKTISRWGNPNTMQVANVRRYPGRVTFELHTVSAVDSSSGRYLSKCVKLELEQLGDDIHAKALSPTYQVWADFKFDSYYEVDEVIAGNVTGLDYREWPLRTSDDANGGYGVNALALERIGVSPVDTVVFTGKVDSDDGIKAGVHALVAIDGISDDVSGIEVNPSGPSGAVAFRNGSMSWSGEVPSGGGKVLFEATRAVDDTPYHDETEEFWFVTNVWTKVATGRRLSDLLICTNRSWTSGSPDGVHVNTALDADRNFSWCYMGGSYLNGDANLASEKNVRHPANFYNLKYSDEARTNATVQVQCQQRDMIRCVWLDLMEKNGDIYASVAERAAAYCDVTGETMRADERFAYETLLGADLDIIMAMTNEEKEDYGFTGNQQTAYRTNGARIGIRYLNLEFGSPATYVVSTAEPCRSRDDGLEYVVEGVEHTHMALCVKDKGGLPTNGVVTVKDGGELWLEGAWSAAAIGTADGMSGGTCALRVEKGGIVRQRCYYPFGINQDISVDGGMIVFEGVSKTGVDLGVYFNAVELRDGAVLDATDERAVKVGFRSAPVWIIGGSLPSTNNVAVQPVSGSSNVRRSFGLDVSDTGDHSADFVFNGDIERYVEDSMTNCIVRKTGDGTLLMNGCYDNPGALELMNGVFRLGRSGLWTGGAEMMISGGAVLCADAGTDNSIGALHVGEGGAVIQIKSGASVSFADSSSAVWDDAVEIVYEGRLDGDELFFGTGTGGLTRDQVSRMRHDGVRIRLDANGGVCDAVYGMVIVVK